MAGNRQVRIVILSFLFLGLVFSTLPAVSAQPESSAVTYSLVHISDIQSLTTHHPVTCDLTFAQIESLKERFNITAIIITGDVVNAWDDKNDWDTYRHARNLTTIPVFVIAGNHDAEYNSRYENYTRYTRMPEENYITSVGDFDLVGINYINESYPASEFSRIRASLISSPRSHAIIATHYYMDENQRLSPLGEDIDTNLVVKPSLILMGHMHGNFLRQRMVGGFPTVADMTNYQDGFPGGTTGLNYSAGTMYTITSVNGNVESIRFRIIHIYPDASVGEETGVFPAGRDKTVYPAGMAHPVVIPAAARPESSCTDNSPACVVKDFIRECYDTLLSILS